MSTYIYSAIDSKTNSYDYNDDHWTTDRLDVALGWIEDGDVEQVAKLDACSLEYLGYLDIDDVYDNYMDDIDDYDEEGDDWDDTQDDIG